MKVLTKEISKHCFKCMLQRIRYCRKSCPANALYTSKTIQSEFISIIGGIIRQQIIRNLSVTCPYYSIIADELTDTISNQTVLSLCIRYLKHDTAICESFTDFAYVERGTSAALKDAIFKQLETCGIKKEHMRGQAYDTTSTMSSDTNGLQAKVREVVPMAIYSPCNAHKLNLVIANASKLTQIRNCVTAINEAFLFFYSSPKRQ